MHCIGIDISMTNNYRTNKAHILNVLITTKRIISLNLSLLSQQDDHLAFPTRLRRSEHLNDRYLRVG
jgi:hypothetical protein